MKLLREPGVAAVMAVLPEARVVGGAVRDSLLGRPVADVDFATPALPGAVTERLEAAGLRAVPTGLAHGTVTAVTPHGAYEITTLRRDEATDGRHATVAFTDDWREDAARRDFTINAMSVGVDAAVHDYFDGRADLDAGRVRFVGDPEARITEDYLRIPRFFRFWARYGRLEPDIATLTAIRDGVPGLTILSVERVWHELRRIFAAPAPVEALRLMEATGVLPALLPEGTDVGAVAALVARNAPVDPLMRMAALLPEGAEGALERLRLSTVDREAILAMRSGPVPAADMDDDALNRLLADTPAQTLAARAWLRGGGKLALLHARLMAMTPPVFPLSGRDAVAAGVPPGPAVGALLRAVRDWWLANGTRPDFAACRAELARRVSA